jgi:GR25 family glycosyltransferase involved in LPS biosynthesis
MENKIQLSKINFRNENISNDFNNKNLSFNGYCINLERRLDRWNYFLKEKPKELNIERFNAVDGKNFIKFVEKEPLDEFESILKLHCKENGNITGLEGCFLSHYRLWKKIANQENIINENQLIFVFEDDVQFSQGFMNRLKESFKDLDENFDLIYIGGRSKINFLPSKFDLKNHFYKISNNIFKYKNNLQIKDLQRTTSSYLISKLGAKKLIEEFKKYSFNHNLLYISPVDRFLNLRHSKLNMGDVFPHICWSSSIFLSDISK